MFACSGESSDVRAVARANNEFAYDLYTHLTTQSGNLVFSPFSIDTGLAMTYVGARGNTARQMAPVLHLQAGDTNVPAAFGALLEKWDRPILEQCVWADSIWVQQGYAFLESAQKVLREEYRADVRWFDITDPPNAFDAAKADASRLQMNNWVSNKTAGRISEIVRPGLPDQDTVLVLINVCYFRGYWKKPFSQPTRELSFHVNAKKAVSVPMMHVHSEFGYAESEDLQALELPYLSGEHSMLILLPTHDLGLEELAKALTASRIEELCLSLHQRSVSVTLPKFKEMSKFDLRKALQSMGMKDAFSMADGDFSGFSRSRPLFINSALHKARVSVNERGTEAEAGTIALMERGIPQQSIVFNADHPFLFVIRHNPTGVILFLGRLVNPAES
jgi:serpin B